MSGKLEERLPTCTCGELKPGYGHSHRCPTLTSLVDVNGKPKVAPVQGYAGGIPWSVHLRAYDAYCAKWGSQASLIDLDRRGCRGGFGVKELDDFVPGWRNEVSEITRLKGEVAAKQALIDELVEGLEEAREQLWHLAADKDENYLVRKLSALISKARSSGKVGKDG